MAYGEITKVSFPPNGEFKDYEGIVIETEMERIWVLIDNHSQCCESWGCLFQGIPIDDEESIRDELLGMTVVDVRWNSQRENEGEDDWKNRACVDIHCDGGTAKVDVFCEHDGYYPHTAKVHWKNYDDEQQL